MQEDQALLLRDICTSDVDIGGTADMGNCGACDVTRK